MIPKIGMGITIQVGSDAYPGTIVSVAPSGKSFMFVRDPYVKSLEEHARHKPSRAFQRDDGKWYYKFGTRKHHAWYVYLGVRQSHRDPSF